MKTIDIDVPPKQRNPYNIWFHYADKDLIKYNRIAIKYNMARLQFPLNINDTTHEE